jgi:hypothetical protein
VASLFDTPNAFEQVVPDWYVKLSDGRARQIKQAMCQTIRRLTVGSAKSFPAASGTGTTSVLDLLGQLYTKPLSCGKATP